MRERFLRELAAAGLPIAPETEERIARSQFDGLPEPARRYLDFMGVESRPQDWSFRLSFIGRFRTKPKQPWMPCETWQYNSRIAVARIFHIRIRMAGLFPVIARDTYVHGRGQMRVRLMDLFTIVDGTGEEYDIGELVTYLNDAVLIAPSMLFSPGISWSAVDAGSFDLKLTDHGRTVSARVFVDAQGAPRDFTTNDRFCYDPEMPQAMIRAQWTTPIAEWQVVNGRPLPASGQAVWHLPKGPFAYADFRLLPESVAFNVRPGE